jgi:hypothetical protein
MENIFHFDLNKNGQTIILHVKDKLKSKGGIVNWYKQHTKKLLDEKLPIVWRRITNNFRKRL